MIPKRTRSRMFERRCFEKLTTKQIQAIKTTMDKDSSTLKFLKWGEYNIAYAGTFAYATKGSLDELKDVFGNEELRGYGEETVRDWLTINDYEFVGKWSDIKINNKSDDGKTVVAETPSGYGMFVLKTLNEMTKFFSCNVKQLELYVRWNIGRTDGFVALTSPTKDEIAITVGDSHLARERDFKDLEASLEHRILEYLKPRLSGFTVFEHDKSETWRVSGVHISSDSLDLEGKYKEGFRMCEMTVHCQPSGSAKNPYLEVFIYAPDMTISPKIVARFKIKHCFTWKDRYGDPDESMIEYEITELQKVADGQNVINFSDLEVVHRNISILSLDYSDSFDDVLPMIADEVKKVCDEYTQWVDEIRYEISKQFKKDPDIQHYLDTKGKCSKDFYQSVARYYHGGEVPDVQYPETLKAFINSPYANEGRLHRRRLR